MSEELRSQLTKLSIQYIRIGATLEKLEIPNLRTYAEEFELDYGVLRKCLSMYRLAKGVKALITDDRYEPVPEEQDNIEYLYPHLR
jgi:hypothetical protein